MAAAGVPWLVPAFMANFPIPPDHSFSDPDPISQPQLHTPFDIAEYLLNMDDDIGDAVQQQQQQQKQQQQLSQVMQGGSSSSNTCGRSSSNYTCMMEGGMRVAFRTKSEVEILDDGFKWRKYGKKSVKNNSHPRNYYRCSTEGCSVKKRVERDREDPSYVITTYDGVHNHTSPSVIYDTMRDDTSGQFLVSGCQMRSTP